MGKYIVKRVLSMIPLLFVVSVIVFMFIHIYLANIEGFAPTKLMFIQKEHGGLVYDPEKHNIVGEDESVH